MYKGEKADSLEGRITAQLEQVLPELEELYAEGLADASGTGRPEIREGAKKAAPEGGVKYQARSNGSLDEAEIEIIQKIGRKCYFVLSMKQSSKNGNNKSIGGILLDKSDSVCRATNFVRIVL